MVNPIECLENKKQEMVEEYRRILNTRYGNSEKSNCHYIEIFNKSKEMELISINIMIIKYRDLIEYLTNLNDDNNFYNENL